VAKPYDSAKKRHRQSERRRLANKSVKSSLHTAARRFQEAVAAKDAKAMDETLKALIKKLDTAAGKKIIAKNAAARKKTRMQKLYNKQNIAPKTVAVAKEAAAPKPAEA
jgi:small subunit ribosomal protein S20